MSITTKTQKQEYVKAKKALFRAQKKIDAEVTFCENSLNSGLCIDPAFVENYKDFLTAKGRKLRDNFRAKFGHLPVGA